MLVAQDSIESGAPNVIPRRVSMSWRRARLRMQLVEQHRIDCHDSRWGAIDGASFASKNLYNAPLYLTRQAYLNDQSVIGYAQLDKLTQSTSEYRALPAKVA